MQSKDFTELEKLFNSRSKGHLVRKHVLDEIARRRIPIWIEPYGSVPHRNSAHTANCFALSQNRDVVILLEKTRLKKIPSCSIESIHFSIVGEAMHFSVAATQQ